MVKHIGAQASAPSVKLPPKLVDALNATGLPWTAEQGARHTKIRLDGRLVGILSRSTGEGDRRALLNTISQVRRAARQHS